MARDSKNEIPGLLQFAKACFKPGQFIEEHKHQSMYEVFYINYGKIAFKNENDEILAEKGDTIIVEPETMHGLRFLEDTEMIYFNLEVQGEG